MRELVILAIHLLVTLAKLVRPGGVRAVAAESLLTTLDRFVLGLSTLFVSPRPSGGSIATLCSRPRLPFDREFANHRARIPIPSIRSCSVCM